jgi:16S rRNA (guanine527-N7)-methyltransferase
MNSTPAELFAAGLQELNLNLDTASQQKLLHFLDFLKKWSAHFNLTAITDPSNMIFRHLLDSLSIAPYITGNQILDVGSGAGFPGIPLAVYFPHKHWTLLDSNGKKTRFLIQAAAELQLANVTVVNERVERWKPLQKFDTIVARAVGSVAEIISLSRQHLQPNGQWLLMKGHPQPEELTGLQSSTIIHPLKVPGISEPRNLIIVTAA